MDPVQKDADMSASSISLKIWGFTSAPSVMDVFRNKRFRIYVSIFEHAGRDIQTEIAKEWAVTPEVLRSWMRSLNTLRNTCAHHGRLWNNVWGTPPKLPPWHSQRDGTPDILWKKAMDITSKQ